MSGISAFEGVEGLADTTVAEAVHVRPRVGRSWSAAGGAATQVDSSGSAELR